MTGATSTLRLLVLSGATTRKTPVIETLQQQHDVILVHSMEEALNELRDGGIDAVLSDSADFLPLERALASQQSGLILDTIGEGICITDEAGQVLWANRRMRQWVPAVRERIRKVCQDAWQLFTMQMTPPEQENAQPMVGHEAGDTAVQESGLGGVAGGAAGGRSRKFSFSVGEQYFELFCSPVMDSRRQVSRVVAICWDATGGRRLQQKIDAIDHAGRELVRLEGEAIARLNVGQRLKLLEEKIINFCRQLMHFDHFAIRLLDGKTNKLELVICVGLPSEATEVELFAMPEGNGISGYVASTGRSYICADVMKDARYVTGLHNARSCLTVPLLLHDKVIGIFNIESQQAAAFSEDDRQFAEIFGRYVAVALNILNLLVVERHRATGQLASDVSSEISAPLNDIVSEVTLLMEDYIGNEEIRGRLTQIVENVQKIRASIREVAEGPRALLGADNAPAKADPLLAGKRVLVADDEPNIRQTIADLLVRFGCHVDMAKDGAEACALLAAQVSYDLVLSDIKMPHRSGYEIFAAAQKLATRPAVILMTGFGYDPNHSIVRATTDSRAGGDGGLAAVLFKPFKVDQLMAEIRGAVGGRKG